LVSRIFPLLTHLTHLPVLRIHPTHGKSNRPPSKQPFMQLSHSIPYGLFVSSITHSPMQ
jgi:hypothetical protein